MSAPPSPQVSDKIERELEQGRTNRENALRQVLTNGTLSSEDFERLYLSPKNQVAGELRKTFANPTPLALLGFSVGLTPLAIEYMGWHGSGGDAVATTGATFWFGGFLLILAGLGEFILGNTFPFIVFMGYGCHFLTVASTFIPWFNAVGFYNTTGNPADITPTFLNSFGFYPIALCILSFIYLIGSLRTNAVFVLIFLCATSGFGCAAAGQWAIAAGHTAFGTQLIVVVGALFFVAALCGWYLLLAEVIVTMELPIPDLPIFDLSTVIPARPRRKQE